MIVIMIKIIKLLLRIQMLVLYAVLLIVKNVAFKVNVINANRLFI